MMEEDLEMDELNREEWERSYNEMDEDDINEEYDDLELRNRLETLRDNPDSVIRARIEYIDNMRKEKGWYVHKNDWKTTSNINDFIERKRGVKLNTRTDAWKGLRRFIGTDNDGNVTLDKLGRPEIVLVRDGDSFKYNDREDARESVKFLKENINRVVAESEARNEIGDTLPMVDKTGPGLNDSVMNRLSNDDRRVVNGVLNPNEGILVESRIGDRGAIQIEIDRFRRRGEMATEEARRTSNVDKAGELYKEGEDFEEVAKAFEDQRQREEVREEQEEDLTRFQKFKEWAKENMLGLSAVGIAIAGIVTSIVVAGRNAVFKGAQAVGALGKMLAKVGKSLGPLLAPLMSLLANVISWGAKGLLWLSQNLFVLVIAAAYLAFDYWKKKNKCIL